MKTVFIVLTLEGEMALSPIEGNIVPFLKALKDAGSVAVIKLEGNDEGGPSEASVHTLEGFTHSFDPRSTGGVDAALKATRPFFHGARSIENLGIHVLGDASTFRITRRRLRLRARSRHPAPTS